MAIYRVRTVFSGVQGAPYLNTLYFITTGGTAQQAVAATGTFWGAIDADMQLSCTWATEAEVATINQETGQITAITGTTPVTGAGAVVTEILPPANQGLVRWTTSGFVNGRRIRGRTFVPALTEAAATAGKLTTAVGTRFQTAADALIADLNSELAIWHRPVLGAGGRNDAVVAASVWTELAVLRSRRQ